MRVTFMPSLCFLPHTRMHEGVKQFVCLSVSLFVSLVESFKSEYRQISKTDSSIDIVKKSDLCVPHRKQSSSVPSAFPAVSYLLVML